jgi:hypothetical protein
MNLLIRLIDSETGLAIPTNNGEDVHPLIPFVWRVCR